MYNYVYGILYLVTRFHMPGSSCALATAIRPYLKKALLGGFYQSAKR